MDWKNITEELQKPLNKAYVLERQGLSYIEGWRAIEEANRIFGHNGWNRETVYNKEISRETTAKGQHMVGYEAKVKITIDGVTREGTGYGSGYGKTLFDAMEGAGKEAETDAMKRALMTFGYPLGLALYDKKQENVAAAEPSSEDKLAAANKYLDRVIADLNSVTSVNELDSYIKSEKSKLDRLDNYPELKSKFDEHYDKVFQVMADKAVASD